MERLLPVEECSVGDSHTFVRLQVINSIFHPVQFDFLDDQGPLSTSTMFPASSAIDGRKYQRAKRHPQMRLFAQKEYNI